MKQGSKQKLTNSAFYVKKHAKAIREMLKNKKYLVNAKSINNT